MINTATNLRLLTWSTLFLIINACQQKPADGVIWATKLKSIEEYNADQFLINIVDIASASGQVYLVEEGLSKIVRTDMDLSSFELFGDRGMGPAELISPALINLVSEDTLLVYDKQKFKFYEFSRNDGRVGEGIAFNRMLLNTSLLATDSVVYFTSPIQSEFDIERYDLKNEQPLAGFDLPETAAESKMGRNIFSFQEGYLLLGGFSPPFIETYNAAWQLQDSHELVENELIKKLLREDPTLDLNGNLKVTEGRLKIQATARLVVRNARLVNDHLYLLTYHKNPDNINRSNMIFLYAREDNQWKLKKSIGLPEQSSYKTFHVDETKGRIIAFDEINSKLDLFEFSR